MTATALDLDQLRSDPVELVLARLEERGCDPRPSGDGWKFRCPCHGDEKPSGTLHRGDDGRALVRCHAGCETTEIVAALDLPMAALFSHSGVIDGNGRREIVATYPYVDERGELLFEVVRFEPKSFAQRRPDGAGDWDWTTRGTRRVVYRLPGVLAAVERGETVYLVEGEKDVHALEAIGLVATCNPGGAGKWRAEYGDALRGGRVVVLADRDDTGRRHAQQVTSDLHDIAAAVDLREPKIGKDVAELIELGGTVPDDLLELAERAEAVASSVPSESRQLVAEAPAFSTITPKHVRYLLPGVPEGMLSLLGGNAGLGKSLLTARWAAEVTRGGPREAPGGVLMLLAEDAPAETTRPRLEAHGAELDRVRALRLRQDGGEVGVILPDHLAHVRDVVQRHAIRLVVIDPINSFLPARVDYARDPDVRGVLAPLARLAAELGIAILLVVHLNKSQVSEALHRIGGSVAYGAVIRSAFILDRDPDDPDGEQGSQRVLVHAKSNVGPKIASSIVRVEPVTIAGGYDTARLVHVGDSSYGASELLEKNATRRGSGPRKIDAAKELMRHLLGDGDSHPAAEIKTTLTAAGISKATIDRARGELPIETESRGFPSEGFWRLASPLSGPGSAPSSSSPADDEAHGANRSTELNLPCASSGAGNEAHGDGDNPFLAGVEDR